MASKRNTGTTAAATKSTATTTKKVGKSGKSSGNTRSAITGQYVTRATAARSPGTTIVEKSGSSSGTTQPHRSAVSGQFTAGSTVRVPLGARNYEATVLEERNGRVRVEVHVAEAAPITTSYLPTEVQPR